MKREDVLQRLGYTVPSIKKKRVIVHSDIAAEADDPFAVVHHLLTPSEDVVGIIAANYEWRYRTIPPLKPMAGQSMAKSYEEGRKILKLMEIDDVPLYHGAADYIMPYPEGYQGDDIRAAVDMNHLPASEGADFIISEAMRDCDEPLYIALQGTLSDLAIAYLKRPEIADRITAAIWIGGSAYPAGGRESNMQQDVLAAKIVFDSPIPFWQIPSNVYARSYVSFAELMTKVRPCGPLGEHLVQTMLGVNDWYGAHVKSRMEFPHGEVWSIGDQPTVSVLLQSTMGSSFHEECVTIDDKMNYIPAPANRAIRVYDGIDMRLTLADLYAKLQLCCQK